MNLPTRIRRTQYSTVVLAFAMFLATLTAEAGPLDERLGGRPLAKNVHAAEHSVDYAWEVYHRAALGGTIASPALQIDIEQHLHEARSLLTQAYFAVEHDDQALVRLILVNIAVHTNHAITGSREHKP